ncbi:unnamed protein product [Didymodactylos carnosus]|uniref:Kinesin motor domain-containing protein n=1 Tax=Didymodactylos carnosus TaxID=1234261 RepID=A0A813R2P5_9BILA|nr:unnamed protein product [Didymodactylos carnosus]CAF3560344.1 unnamed protein product [Didymodactylos carnosus]
MWDQKLRLSNERMELYAMNELQNIERIRNAQEQITKSVDEMMSEFKTIMYNKLNHVLQSNQLLPTQLPNTLAPSTLMKDCPNLTSEIFFNEMEKRYFTNDASFEKYAETLEFYRSTWTILKQENDYLRSQMQEKMEKALLERDTYVTLYTMEKTRSETCERKLRHTNKLLDDQLKQLSNKENVAIQNFDNGIKSDEYDKLKNQIQELELQIKKEKEINFKQEQSLIEQHQKSLNFFIHERRNLFNTISASKGNIQMLCRIRPPLDIDGSSDIIVVKNKDIPTQLNLKYKGQWLPFSFETIFSSDDDQQRVFQEIQSTVFSVLDGTNVCIMAYGMTSSGKTFTIQGSENDPGISRRALKCLFEQASYRSNMYTININVSCIEIYNNTICDLLSTDQQRLVIRMKQDGENHIPGVTIIPVTSQDDVQLLFSTASLRRRTASTVCNEASSRSHMLLIINIQSENIRNGEQTNGRLLFLDLAGSEKVDRSELTGERLNEANYINKSLSELGNVIRAIGENQAYVPFRNCELTYFLKDTLTNNSKIIMITQIAPTQNFVDETLSTLRFAHTARAVRRRNGDGLGTPIILLFTSSKSNVIFWGLSQSLKVRGQVHV